MAKRKSPPKRKQKDDWSATLLTLLQRPDVVGVMLVLIAVFTLLSLVTSSTGTITGVWIDWLQMLFGIGVWGFPIVIGATGLWMVIHAVKHMADMPWRQPVGCALLFAALIVAITLWMGPEYNAGGMVGAALAEMLQSILGIGLAWTFIGFLAISGLVFLADLMLVDFWQALWYQLQTMSGNLTDGRERKGQPTIEPVVPLPSGKIAWWKSLVDRWSRPADDDLISTLPRATNMVRPTAGVVPANRAERVRPPLSPATPTQVAPSSRGAVGGLTAGEPELLTPKIVGSAQEWRLPRLEEMLNNWERHSDSDDLIRDQGRMIQETLALFGVPADFEGAYKGPAVTQYLIKPGYLERTVQGETKRIKIKVAKIAGLANDLALALAAPSVRIDRKSVV